MNRVLNDMIRTDAYGISAAPSSSTRIQFLLMCHVAAVIVACL